mmetsp:Transcript_68551/g.142931  ORF Transcript_68551/g.142931 Transcript_68551/m.142931 type:complete len:228 (-) Transcript_68551:387-1070(-)
MLSRWNAASHRSPPVQVVLDVVARAHGVTPPEVEEVGCPPQHRLLDARAPSEPEVVQPAVRQPEQFLVDGLHEGLLDDVAHETRERRHARGVPHHVEDGFEEGAEAGGLALRGDDEHGGAHVCNRALRERLYNNREVAIMLVNKFEEKIFRKRVRCGSCIVSRVKGLCCFNIGSRPPSCHEVLNAMPHAVEYEAIIINTNALVLCSKFSVGSHASAFRVHVEVSCFV